MAMTRAEINAKSDKKRGVRVQSYKLHENTIVAKGIDKMTEIQITISNLCKYSHFYADEYAAFLYDAIIHKYPNAKITFILSNECKTNIMPQKPYIRQVGSEGNILADIENICQKTCDLLIEKCKDRRLHSSSTPEPSIYPNEPKIEKIWYYLRDKGVNMFTLGWQE